MARLSCLKFTLKTKTIKGVRHEHVPIYLQNYDISGGIFFTFRVSRK